MFKIRRFHRYLNRISTIKYVLLMGTIGFVLTILFVNLIYYGVGINISEQSNNQNDFFLGTLLSAIVLAPLLETLIFQAMIITILEGFSLNNSLKILISAVCFAMIHLVYNIFHAMGAFLIGIILAYSFILYKEKSQNPILIVTFIHGLINTLSIVTSYF